MVKGSRTMSDIKIKLEFVNYNSSAPDGLCFNDKNNTGVTRESLNSLAMNALHNTEELLNDGDSLIITIGTEDKEALERRKSYREEKEEKRVNKLVEERLASLLKQRGDSKKILELPQRHEFPQYREEVLGE
jgi:hypothetical protein